MKFKRRTFKLDPKKTAMENLFSAAYVASATLLFAKHLSISDDESDELLDEIILNTVSQFLRLKIQQKKYNRNFDFYRNVFSCAWSVSPRTIEKYLDLIRQKLVSYSDWKPDLKERMKRLPFYANKKEIVSAKKNLKSWKARSIGTSFLKVEDEDEYMTELECRLECGIDKW